jgi:adenylate kinase
VADAMGIPHISAGDLVRHEIKHRTPYGRQAQALVESGKLLPDSMILQLLRQRVELGYDRGELGFLLDGFPRTRLQAEAMSHFTDVQLAINLQLREEVLTAKCLGRRVCRQCNKNFNIADIMLPATEQQPEIKMPPLSPPAGCLDKMEMRADDTLDVIRRRLQIYKDEAVPVEEYFDEQGLLMNFEITGGIPETLPRLIDALRPHMRTITEQRRKWNAKQAQLNSSSSASSQASTASSQASTAATAASRLTVAAGSASPAYGLGVSTSHSGRQLQLAQA